MRADAQDHGPDDGVSAGDGDDLRAHWQVALDDWPAPACVVDERLQVVAVNAPAAASGLTVGADVDTVLGALGAPAGAPHDSCTLRWQPVRDHQVRGWLIGRSDDTSLPAAGTSEPASTAQRLAASNLRLQEEISRRRRLERQILAVAENEKQRISLELHDGLGQHLTGVSFVARTLADKLRYAQHAEAQEADWLVRLLNEAITRTRALARGLWPVSLERDSLGQSVRKLAEDLESIFGVSCAVQVVDEPRIASQFAAHHVFRIVQEAATNAIKHGRARRLTFRLEMVGEEFTVCVINDGLPVDPEQLAAGKGLGVVGMRLRADAVGGHLSIEPLPGGGSEVTLSLPGVASVQSSDVEE
jgi:signal transduction histidine kinase